MHLQKIDERRIMFLTYRFAVVAILMCWSPVVFAADQDDLVKLAVNQSTVIIARVDSSAFMIPESLRQIAAQDRDGRLDQWIRHSDGPTKSLQNAFRGEDAYLAVDLPYEAWFRGMLLVPSVVAQDDLKGVLATQFSIYDTMVKSVDDWSIATLRSKNAPQADSLDDDDRVLPKQWSLYRQSFSATSEFPIQVCVVFPAHIRKMFSEVNVNLPPQFGGGRAKTLIAQVQWMSLGLNIQTGEVRLVVETTGPETVEAIRTQVPQVLHALLKTGTAEDSTLELLAQWIDGFEQQVFGNRIVFSRQGGVAAQQTVDLIAKAIAAERIPLVQSTAQAKLKRMLAAIDDYHSAKGFLPTYESMVPGSKKSGLSWRVHILPFIGHADLYKEFKLDEAWDSQHNRSLLNRMPELFLPEGATGADGAVPPFHTTYVAPVGDGTAFGREFQTRYANVIDGMSYTIAIVELEPQHSIAWTSPEEYRYDREAPIQKMRFVDGRTLVGFLDGSVRWIRQNEAVTTWNALFTAQGGERLPELME